MVDDVGAGRLAPDEAQTTTPSRVTTGIVGVADFLAAGFSCTSPWKRPRISSGM
jgi:hypothetical protein